MEERSRKHAIAWATRAPAQRSGSISVGRKRPAPVVNIQTNRKQDFVLSLATTYYTETFRTQRRGSDFATLSLSWLF